MFRDDNSTIHRPFRRYGKAYFDFDASGGLELKGVPVPNFRYASGARVGEVQTGQERRP